MAEDHTKMFLESLETRQKALIAAVQRLMDCCVCGGDMPNRKACAQKVNDCALAIRDFLADKYHPQWLISAIQATRRFASNPEDGEAVKNLGDFLSTGFSAMRGHKWAFDQPLLVGFNLEDVFRTACDANAIPELFDEIIDILLQIVGSEEIDSIRLQKELQEIIDLLKSSRNGTYGQTRSAWIFFGDWFKNSLWEICKSMPVVGPVIKGLHTTIEKGNRAIAQVDTDVKVKMQEFGKERLHLTNQQNMPRLTDESIFEVKTEGKLNQARRE